MLYYLSTLKDVWGGFNVFQYITFRTGGAALSSLFLSLLLGPWLIAKLKSYRIGQVQRKDAPSTHLSKEGTPTMGGFLILAAVLVNVFLWARLDNRFIWLLIIVTVVLAGIGFVDDYLKLAGKDPKGASSRQKLAVQVLLAAGVMFYLAVYPPNYRFDTVLGVPYVKELYISLGFFYYILGMLVIVGTSNAVNLTDGLDGLAAGSVIFSALAYIAFAYVAGHARFSSYLKIIPVEGAGEITVFLAALVGACLGFLWFNSYPAEVFMGDVSSLFLGGVIGVTALCVKQELILVVVGGIFVLEVLSVLVQMFSYRFRRRRIFKMAPLHHHFELVGWAEPKVTVRFWIVSIVLMLVALSSLKIR